MAWLGSLCGFDAQTYNPSQEKKIITKKKENVILSVLHLYVTVSLCVMSLCGLWSLCVFAYVLVLFTLILYHVELQL